MREVVNIITEDDLTVFSKFCENLISEQKTDLSFIGVITKLQKGSQYLGQDVSLQYY